MPSAAAILAAATPRRLRLPDRGVDLAILDWGGDGPLALLHHANGFCKGVWVAVIEQLSPAYRVVAMDARGHGDSSKPHEEIAYAWDEFAEDAAAVAEAIADGQRIALGLGNSFGGTALVGAAARRPELFERLVLVDPVVPPPGVDPELRSPYTSRLVEGARRRRSHWPSRDAARAFFRERSLFAAWQDVALDGYVLDGLADTPDGGVALKCPGAIEAMVFGASLSVDLFARARALACPTLVLWAARGAFPRPIHEALAAAMPHGRFVAVEAGHLMPMERPDVVLGCVRRFTRAGATGSSA